MGDGFGPAAVHLTFHSRVCDWSGIDNRHENARHSLVFIGHDVVFFTGVTYFDALYEPVPDCGCFGDAIKLTNWQTFYKNIVLMVFVLAIFFNRKQYKIRLYPAMQWFFCDDLFRGLWLFFVLQLQSFAND